jgi:formate/nitrite transporter FocA (FNT family)
LRIDVGNGAASGAFLRLRQGRQVTMGRAERIKKEVRELLVAAVFFSTGLCLVILAGRLMTEGTGMEIATWWTCFRSSTLSQTSLSLTTFCGRARFT